MTQKKMAIVVMHVQNNGVGEMDTAQKALIIRTVAETYHRTEAERCLGA